MKKVIILGLFYLVSCKTKSNYKINTNEESILASFKQINDTLLHVSKNEHKHLFTTKLTLYYVCTINNKTKKTIKIPCEKWYNLVDNSLKNSLITFQDSLFYQKKSMQKFHYFLPYTKSNYTEIKKGEEKQFLYTFEKWMYNEKINIDSIIFDISYINNKDTTKQFIYFAKSNVDSFPKFSRE